MRSPQVYDAELHMFVQEPRLPNPRHLEFLRWLAEQGRLEHQPASDPVGPFAVAGHASASAGQDWLSAA